MTAPTIRQALCPRCNRWSDLAWDDAIPPGGFWWKDTAGCPHCGYMALPESECEHREVPAGYVDPHDRVAGAWFDFKVAVADRVGPLVDWIASLQLVTWWRPRDWALGFDRFDPATNGLGIVYRWSLHLGPVEIRRWQPDVIKDEDGNRVKDITMDSWLHGLSETCLLCGDRRCSGDCGGCDNQDCICHPDNDDEDSGPL